jgi:hypothetical protein
MQYMLLIYADPSTGPVYGTPEFQAMLAGYGALTKSLKADGAWVAGDALQGVQTATSLRVRGGKIETMDGPFAETKEHLGGYYLIDAPDLDSALAYAARIPTATHGTVEVRPLVVWN